MALSIPTKKEIKAELQAFLLARLPDIRVTDDSDAGVRIAMLSEALYGVYAQANATYQDLFVSADTSTEALVKHAEARLGSDGIKGGTVANGIDAVRVWGTDGTVFVSGYLLAYSDATQYQITEGGTIGTTPNNYADVSVQSVTKGTVANRVVGDSLTFESPPADITATADIVVAVTGGTDKETDGALVTRLQDAYQNPPAGGRATDWRQWAASIAGVSRGYVYAPSSFAQTGRRGLGTVDVAILQEGTGTARIPAASVKTAVEEYAETQRPTGASDYEVVLCSTSAENVTVDLEIHVGFDSATLISAGETAIQALFDALGPARGSYADPYDVWNDTLRLASIYDVLMDIAGVKDVTITTPVANVAPAISSSDIELLIPGTITVTTS